MSLTTLIPEGRQVNYRKWAVRIATKQYVQKILPRVDLAGMKQHFSKIGYKGMRYRKPGISYTAKLTRAKLPANCGNFTCSLSVKTGEFTRVYAVRTSRRIYAKFLQPHVNLLENNGYFKGKLHAELIQTGKNTGHLPAKTRESQMKIPAKCKNKLKHRQKHPQLHRKILPIAGNLLSHRG